MVRVQTLTYYFLSLTLMPEASGDTDLSKTFHLIAPGRPIYVWEKEEKRSFSITLVAPTHTMSSYTRACTLLANKLNEIKKLSVLEDLKNSKVVIKMLKVITKIGEKAAEIKHGMEILAKFVEDHPAPSYRVNENCDIPVESPLAPAAIDEWTDALTRLVENHKSRLDEIANDTDLEPDDKKKQNMFTLEGLLMGFEICLLYTSPSPRDRG